MASPGRSRRKSLPWRLPPLVNSNSKSNFTRCCTSAIGISHDVEPEQPEPGFRTRTVQCTGQAIQVAAGWIMLFALDHLPIEYVHRRAGRVRGAVWPAADGGRRAQKRWAWE